MNKNNKIEDSLNKIFSTSGYKMVDVSSKETTHRKALAVGEIILNAERRSACYSGSFWNQWS